MIKTPISPKRNQQVLIFRNSEKKFFSTKSNYVPSRFIASHSIGIEINLLKEVSLSFGLLGIEVYFSMFVIIDATSIIAMRNPFQIWSERKHVVRFL